MTFQFQFNPNQPHQKSAIQSVVSLFEGQFLEHAPYSAFSEIVPNLPEGQYLDEELLSDNLREVQLEHNRQYPESPLRVGSLEQSEGIMLEGVSNDSQACPHFTIEMETGTGKTYVYLRTMLELYTRYTFRKFIVVVPSVAILEGVKKAVETMKDHLFSLYSKALVVHEYDSERLGILRTFASSGSPSLLIMTRDSFNKAGNKVYQSSEKLQGERKPYQWIQETRPIIILDEPQNMSSEKSQSAIRTLNPLFVLRYSATHREGETPNQTYRLTPVEAFRQGLVKQIEVVGVAELSGVNVPMLRLEEVSRRPITARVRSLMVRDGQTREESFTLKKDDLLFQKTTLEEHQGLGKVKNIVVGQAGSAATLEFEDGTVLSTSDAIVGSRLDIWRVQIEQTIRLHLARQRRMRPLGIKVLTLFFIDKVDNYVKVGSILRQLFEDAFERLKGEDTEMATFEASAVHGGYFAKRKKGSEEAFLDEVADSSAEAKTLFKLIMRDKERLLSFEEPLSFIFAHSALKEGWDNPNVFQICTLNQTSSTMKKRQEIGRGLRLCVDQTGARPEGSGINTLTVIANESYESFVETLQREYRDDGDAAPNKPTKAGKGEVKRRDALFSSSEFQVFWDRLARRLSYHIEIDTEALVQTAVARLNIAPFPEPSLAVSRGRYLMREYALKLENVMPDGDGTMQAWVKVESKDTQVQAQKPLLTPPPIYVLGIGDSLFKKTQNAHFRGFEVSSLTQRYGEWQLEFKNGTSLSSSQLYRFSQQMLDNSEQPDVVLPSQTYPVSDPLARAVEESGLTRATVRRIFLEVKREQKDKMFRNPENWLGTFVSVLTGVLADHIAERVQFSGEQLKPYPLEELFPPVDIKAQTELIDGGARSLYERVQIDSEVETRFVQESLMPDEGDVLVYFKFPPKFKIRLPRVIGNYNPDWGIVRRAPDGTFSLMLIRETKGHEDLERLRFANEGRKIRAAERYFRALGIDYRVVTDKTPKYWESALKGSQTPVLLPNSPEPR